MKILYLTQERTYKRKIREAFLAVKLQNQMSKDEILEGYLNTIYFGRGAYGIQAAAQAYFDKDAKDLTVAESAVLASVLNSPSALDPANGKEARERAARPLPVRARRHGRCRQRSTRPQAAKIYDRLPKFPKIPVTNQYGGQKGYLMTLAEPAARGGRLQRDRTSTVAGSRSSRPTTGRHQKAAQTAVQEQRPEDRPQLHIALASVEPGSGALRAMIGGRDFLKSQFNWATGVGLAGLGLQAVRAGGRPQGRDDPQLDLQRQLAARAAQRRGHREPGQPELRHGQPDLRRPSTRSTPRTST